ncbi:hypothetical protein [Candidatus Pelagibacter sp.]|uniref:hypothetical protein n=1 Tax=Candidatus Pelagibacter sp. TaxID=2024849 RepID=UPI003F83FCDC
MKINKFIFIILVSFAFCNFVNAGWFDGKINVTECYDRPYKSYKHKLDKLRSLQIEGRKVSLIWDWELNLKDKTATRITAFDGIVEMEKFDLLVTDDYLYVKNGNGGFTFDKKTEKVTSKWNNLTNILQCKFD